MSGVVIDTYIWSLAFRSKTPKDKRVAEELARLIDENRARIIGPIRQEVLSGYSEFRRYQKLRDKLQCFPNETILDSDYEVAAEYSNFCRRKGVQGSYIDFLIFAVSTRLKMKIYTSDKDFVNYLELLPIVMHDVS